MNSYQELWWRQAQSDQNVLVSLRRNGAAACHQLHYLQMFEFDLWTKLTNSGRGRQLMQVIRRAVDEFPSYG
jgi:hypothetical protein